MRGAGRIRRLRWMCRRGMKELDLLLEDFLTANEQALRQGAWPRLEVLLETEDDELWKVLRQPGACANPSFADVVDAIRNAGNPGA